MFCSFPAPSPSPVSLSQSSCVSPIGYGRERGWGDGEEPNHTTAKKPGPLYIIQYSLVINLKMHVQASFIISLQSRG